MSDLFDKYLSPSAPKQEEVKNTEIKTNIVSFGNDKKIKEDNPNLETNSNVKLFNKDGLPIFNISQSLIKQFTKKKYDGDVEIKERCPYYIYTCYIAKTDKSLTTNAMLKGLFFEQLCLGRSATDEVIDDLPRKTRPPGEKTTDQIRIEEQAIEFQRLCSQYGIELSPDNVQNKYKQLYKHDFEDECEVYLTGVTDFEHPIYSSVSNKLVDCVIDLKLTQKIDSTFGDYAWGNPVYIDHIQMDMYNYLTGKQGLYWVFDYSVGKKNDMFSHTPEQEDIDRLHFRIRQTIIELMYDYKMEYPANGVYEICKLCPHNPRNGGNCVKACNIKQI